jgi:hypothetical protein
MRDDRVGRCAKLIKGKRSDAVDEGKCWFLALNLDLRWHTWKEITND